ncbi:hypothetical protein LTS07_007220 [Exophiala sideris]|nr:hypothetical protein LTS07_007220 [Exophiala sideris]KAK5033925.1 hypothetical protein LTR13_006525 [Exophiala sideris]KAK5180867.1 hypothetical protein LTR44_006687 [Eurotiomycetes sp. CCFEE 6388]
MASNNPWEDAASQNPWSEDTPSNTHTNQNSGSAQPSYQSTPDTSEYQAPSHPPPGRSSENPWQQGRQAPSLPPRQGPGAQSDADQLLEGQGDRAEQIEHMQQYEASAPQSEADRTQAQLEKEFPNIDGALIAAIYSERPGDLAEPHRSDERILHPDYFTKLLGSSIARFAFPKIPELQPGKCAE